MRIASKLNIVVFGAFALSALANYQVLQETIKPRFDEIELAGAQKNHARVIEAIGTLRESLRASAQDYAFWDNCYGFAQGLEPDFIASTLTPAPKMLENVSVDAAVFLDLDRKVLWAAGNDGSGATSTTGLVPDLLSLDYRHPYLSGEGALAVTNGIMHTAKGPAAVAIAPIVKGDHSGAPKGAVLMLRLLDTKALEEITSVHFKLQGVSPAGTVTDEVTHRTFTNVVETSSLIPGVRGEPVLRLTAMTHRELSKVGKQAIESAMWLMMAAAAVVISALWLFVRSNLVSRITQLKQHFAHAADAGRISESRIDNAADEIGELSRSFNEMAVHVNNMRDAIADSAYLNGVSEWATGTLHNVRNALTPINMYALKVQDLFEDRWCENIRTALAQIDIVDTDPERRDKLNKYVLGSAHRMLANAEQTQKLTDRIIATSKTIEEIVAEYEKFGRRDTQVAPLEIRELAETVVRGVVDGSNAQVKLVLPPTATMVRGNRTILRQILANLFVNAIEAMQEQEREKKIRIGVRRADVPGYVELTVTDNGEGIPAENLRAIFERGFSTRRHKKGGLGLHWCANAAKAMGGSLRAHSDGTGTGATLVLCLPALTSDLQIGEAA